MPDQQQTSWVEARVQALLAQQDWPVGRNLRDVRAQQEAAGVRRCVLCASVAAGSTVVLCTYFALLAETVLRPSKEGAEISMDRAPDVGFQCMLTFHTPVFMQGVL